MRDEIITLSIDDAELRADLKRIGARGNDGTIPLKGFYQEWKATATHEWGRIKATGGTFRGDTWAKMKPQYTRKDGTVVEAWGGNPKVHGRGKVQGRLRPSKQRVAITSTMNADAASGGLKDSMLSNRPDVTPSRLRIGGGLAKYAEHIFKDLDRNPLQFYLPADQDRFHQNARDYIDALCREFNA